MCIRDRKADNSSKDLRYKYLDPPDVTLRNLDTAAGGFYVSAVSGDTAESGTLQEKTATFEVRLRSQPTDNVTITVTSTDTGEGTVSPDNLTFTADDWKAFKPVTITGVADNLSDGDQSYAIRLGADTATKDERYLNLDPPDVSLRNLDTAAGGFYVSAVSRDTAESGSEKTATFEVRLRSAPTDNVTIYVSSSDPGEGTVSPDKLTFTPTDWNAFKPVTITGVADNLSDGDQSYAIRLEADNTSEDLRYKYLDPPDVTLRNLDTAAGGFYVSAVSGDTAESGTNEELSLIHI